MAKGVITPAGLHERAAALWDRYHNGHMTRQSVPSEMPEYVDMAAWTHNIQLVEVGKVIPRNRFSRWVMIWTGTSGFPWGRFVEPWKAWHPGTRLIANRALRAHRLASLFR